MNQYDPNQQPQNQGYPPLGQQPQQPQYQPQPPQPGYQQQPYQQDQQPNYPNYPPQPRASLMDQLREVNVGIIAAAALFVMLCVIGACVVFLGLIRGNPVPAPAAPATATVFVLPFGTPGTPDVIFGTPGTPQFGVTPIQPIATFDPNVINTYINPYYNGRLDTMTQLFIDVLNSQTGQFERKAQLLGGNLDPFITAFNIAGPVSAPNTSCPERVRLTAVRADATQAVFGVCLDNVNQAVVLRSADVTDLNGGDLEMGPYFIDVLAPYLPAEYRQLLGVN